MSTEDSEEKVGNNVVTREIMGVILRWIITGKSDKSDKQREQWLKKQLKYASNENSDEIKATRKLWLKKTWEINKKNIN